MSAMFSINDLVRTYGLSRVWIHRAIMQDKLPAVKEVMPDGKTERWMIKEEDFLHWRETSKRTKRTDGRSRFVLHATPDELEKLQALRENGDTDLKGIQITKQKAYRKGHKVS